MVSDFVTPWTVAHQASLSMGFPRQQYWTEFLFPSPEDLPDPGTELASPSLAEFGLFATESPGALRFYKVKVKVKSVMSNSLETPWTVAYQAPLSAGFSRQEYWSGLPFPSPGALTNPGIKPGSPALQADALPSEPPGKA